jgi:hypothetical protein
MRATTLSIILGLSLSGLPMIGGCDKEVEHTESVKQNPNGTVTQKEETVKKDANGNTITEHTEKTN